MLLTTLTRGQRASSSASMRFDGVISTPSHSAAAAATEDAAEPVPLHLRNAPTTLMKSLDYGRGYQYAHDQPDAVAAMDCLPERLQGRQFYQPTDRGFEKEIKRRLDGWKEIKSQRRGSGPGSRG